jgi:glycosyltransferase involved in cell wall biosynthesis
MLYGVMICFDDFPLIKKTVESLAPIVDEIVAVDGRFSDFPGENDHSTDGTLEYLEGAGARVILAPGLLEAEKRNRYLVGGEGDWYLHLDADEEWTGSLVYPKADMGIVRLRRSIPQHYMDRVRLFRHVEGLHYEGKHYWLKDAEGHTYALLAKPGERYRAQRLEKNLIVHYGEDRLPERVSAKRKYYRVLSKRENAIKEILT